MKPIRTYLPALLILSAVTCTGTGDSAPTAGELTLGCEEAVAPAMEKQRLEFMKRYPKAKIRIQWMNSAPSVNKFLNRRMDMIITTRMLDSTETDSADMRMVKYSRQKIAMDGLAVIVNQNNARQSVSEKDLSDILTGQITLWDDTRPAGHNRADSIIIILENDLSENIRLLKERLHIQPGCGCNVIRLPEDSVNFSSARTLELVAGKPNAIGFISTTWLKENPDYRMYQPLIKILDWRHEDDSFTVPPLPGYFYTGDYPLRRMIYAYKREDDNGLAAGFMGFLCGNEGQQLFLESNATPAVSPVKIKYE